MKRLRKFLSLTSDKCYLLARIVFSYCSLWFLWILASVLSGSLRHFFPLTGLFLLTGPALGFFQWLVLRCYVWHLGWWVMASISGWSIAFFITYPFEVGSKIAATVPKGELIVAGVPVNMQVFWSYVLVALLASTVIGVFQWLVMRRHIQHSSWWILASSIGGALRGATIAVIQSVGGAALGAVVGWLGYGAVTGIVLVWLLQDHIKYRLEYGMYPSSTF